VKAVDYRYDAKEALAAAAQVFGNATKSIASKFNRGAKFNKGANDNGRA
jgi:hypothetical protein